MAHREGAFVSLKRALSKLSTVAPSDFRFGHILPFLAEGRGSGQCSGHEKCDRERENGAGDKEAIGAGFEPRLFMPNEMLSHGQKLQSRIR